MTLVVGTDEAGYGPNLGPLVVAASAWRLAAPADRAEEVFANLAGGTWNAAPGPLWADSKTITRASCSPARPPSTGGRRSRRRSGPARRSSPPPRTGRHSHRSGCPARQRRNRAAQPPVRHGRRSMLPASPSCTLPHERSILLNSIGHSMRGSTSRTSSRRRRSTSPRPSSIESAPTTPSCGVTGTAPASRTPGSSAGT